MSLITDSRNAVTARVVGSGPEGLVEPVVGAPGKLNFGLIQGDKEVKDGDRLVTAGFSTEGGLASRYPADIPIGQVVETIPAQEQQKEQVSVEPFAELSRPERGHGPDQRGFRVVIVTPPILLRLVAIVFLTVLLQIGLFSQIPIFGSVPNLIPVVVVSLGLLGGAVTGAVTGFAAGLLVDVMIGGTLGVASLALMAAGYLAGRWREGYDIVSSLVPPLLIGALTALTALIYGGLTLTLGVEAPVSVLALREVVIQGLLAVLLAVPVFPLIKRVLRPALVDDATRARARASGVGGSGRGGTFGMMRGQGSI